MFQLSILKSILKYRDSGIINRLSNKATYVFSDKENLELYNIIRSLTFKYSEVPDKAFILEYFKLEKNSKTKETYNRIMADKEVETTSNIKGLIDQQLIYYAKKNTLEILRYGQNDIKLSNGSEIQEFTNGIIDELSSIAKVIEQDSENEGLMYYDTDSDEDNYIKAKLISDYDLRKSGKNGYYKFDIGIPQIDQIIGGVHSVDFIGVLGYVKNGKSFLLRQIAYNILCQGKNVVFISLEMSYESIQHSMLSLHANNIGYWGYDSIKIKTADIRSGTLSQKAEDFFRNQVIDDFTTNPEMGSLYIKQPSKEYTTNILFSDIRQLQNNTMDIDLIVIDYPGLMKPSIGRRDRESYNELFRELRHFSLINHIPIIFAIQSNRHGFQSACKDKDNLYSADAISDYNSIEREATHVFSIITTPEMKESGQAQIQHLLSRESQIVPPIRLNCDFETGTITALTQLTKEDAEQMMEEIEI